MVKPQILEGSEPDSGKSKSFFHTYRSSSSRSCNWPTVTHLGLPRLQRGGVGTLVVLASTDLPLRNSRRKEEARWWRTGAPSSYRRGWIWTASSPKFSIQGHLHRRTIIDPTEELPILRCTTASSLARPLDLPRARPPRLAWCEWDESEERDEKI